MRTESFLARRLTMSDEDMSAVAKASLLLNFGAKRGRADTHFLLDGGKLSVGDEDAFMRHYAECICRGERAYVVALKTAPVFALFFDIDAHLQCECDVQWHVNIAKIVRNAVIDMLGESIGDGGEADALVTLADAPKTVRKNGADCVKCGAHIHFPGIHVTTECARAIRVGVVQKLQNVYGRRPWRQGPTDWNEDVDEVVYGRNGLRMLYSRKMELVEKRNVDAGRAYVPAFYVRDNYRIEYVVDGGAQRDVDVVQGFVKLTNIRSSLAGPTHKINEVKPSWLEMPAGLATARPDGGGRGARRSKRAGTLSSMDLNEGVEVVEASLCNKSSCSREETGTVQRWLRNLARKQIIPVEYRACTVLSAFFFDGEDGTPSSQMIARLDSQFCANIAREHCTNRVYVHINLVRRVAHIRCYCRCDTREGRLKRNASGESMKCSEFRSEVISCSTLDVDMLRTRMISKNDILRIIDWDTDIASTSSSVSVESGGIVVGNGGGGAGRKPKILF